MKSRNLKKTKNNLLFSLILVLAFLLTPVSSIFMNTNFVSASTADYTDMKGNEITLKGYESSVEFGEEYYLPTLTGYTFGGSNASLVYEVKAPNGSELTTSNSKVYQSTNADHTNKWCFVAEMKGSYTLNVYAQVDDGTNKTIKTIAKGLNVSVNSTTYSIELPTNAKDVIPAKIAKTHDLIIPAPEVLDANGDVATGGTLKVQVVEADGTAVVLTSTTNNGYTYYKYENTSEKTGSNFQVIYSYLNSNSIILARETQSFEVVDSASFADDLDLAISFLTSKPTTAELGKEVTLPTAKVIDKNSGSTNAISAYVEIKVTHRTTNADGEYVNTDYTSNLDGYKFTPLLAGDYVVTYQAKIGLFGAETKSEIYTFTIADVKDTTDPTPIPVKEYELDATTGKITSINGTAIGASDTEEDILDKLGDRTTDIHSIYIIDDTLATPATNVTVTIPAIYASDNFTTTGNYQELKRYYKAPGSAYVEIDKDENKDATITVSTIGTYYVRYTAKDSSGNDVQKTVASFTVMKKSALLTDYATAHTDATLTTPTVTLTQFSGSMYDNEKLVFAVPTATDTLDSNPVVTTKVDAYVAGNATPYTLTLNDTHINSDGKYEVAISELAVGTIEKVVVSATALNCYNANSSTAISRTINILKSTDTVEPSVYMAKSDWTNTSSVNDALVAVNTTMSAIQTNGYVSGTNAPFDQADTIKLPNIKITDTTDKNVKFKITVADKDGGLINVTNLKRLDASNYATDGFYTIKLSGGEFVATRSGIYTVNIQATDIGGNIKVISFGIRVNDTEAPTIIVTDSTKYNTTWELGNEFIVPVAGLTDDNEEITVNESGVNAITGWNLISWPSDWEYEVSGLGFTPTVEGTYTIQYNGKDESGNDAEVIEYTLLVEDNTKPEVNVEYTGYFATHEFAETINWPETTPATTSINIPVPFATTNEAGATVAIKVVNSASVEKTLKQNSALYGDHYYFTADSQGTYKVTYTATDLAGNTSTKTFELKVGDCIAPTLTWEEGYSIPTSWDLWSESSQNYLYINTSKMILNDADGDNADITYTITLTNPSGNVETTDVTGYYKYKLEETGDYTLKIVVKDAVPNSQTYSYTITVAAEKTEETDNNTNVVGTILIVLSVVVLGGVVVYFVLSNKKYTAKKNDKKRK